MLNLTWKQIDREGDQPGKCLRGKKSRKVFIGRLHCNNIIIDHEDGYRKNIARFAHNEFRPEQEWFRLEIEEVIKTSQD